MLSIRPRTTRPHFHELHPVPRRVALAHVICIAYVHKLEKKNRNANVLILILNPPELLLCYQCVLFLNHASV